MLKLAGRVIDSYDDPKFVNWPGLGASEFPGAEVVRDMKDRDFAVIVKTAAGTSRKYPIATPALTKISAAYFNEYGYQLPEEVREATAFYIKEASINHGIDVDVEVNIAGVVPHSFTLGEGSNSDISVDLDKVAASKRAEDEFLAYYGRMTPLERALAANDLNKVADITDSRVYDYVIKEAVGPNIKSGVKQRMALLEGDVVKTASLKQLLVRMRDVDAGRAAVMLHQFDKVAGFGERVPDAFVTCWGGFVKMAGRTDTDVMSYKIMTLARAHGEQVSRVFSSDVADAFLGDPIIYYEQRAKGQVKTMLTHLANQVGKQDPKSEIRKDAVPDAVSDIRSGDHTPWSKTLTEIRSV